MHLKRFNYVVMDFGWIVILTFSSVNIVKQNKFASFQVISFHPLRVLFTAGAAESHNELIYTLQRN